MQKTKRIEKAKKEAQGFKEFIKNQGLVGMAVGLVLGAASGTLIKSLIDNIIMPPLGLIFGSADGLKGLSVSLGKTAAGDDAILNYGVFLNDFVNFLVIAFTVYLIIKLLSKFFGEDYTSKK